MAEWSQLPKELLDLIAKRLNTSIETLRFRSVCSTWRSSVAPYPDPPLPCFPIPTTHGVCETFSGFHLSKRTIFRLGLPQPNIQTPPQSSSADGWLIKVERGHVTKLLDPLSRGSVRTFPESFPGRLDLLKYSVSELGHEYILRNYRTLANSISDAGNLYSQKVALRSMACSDSGIDSYVLLTTNASGKLAIFKSAEREWTIIDDLPSFYDDVILFEQQFYAVDMTGRTVVVNVDESSPIVNLIAHSFFGGDQKELVESSGELLLVDTYLRVRNDYDLGFDEEFEFSDEFNSNTTERMDRFKVFRLDRREQKWVGVDSLGERMLFLGANCTFSASASDFSVCKGNCIIYLHSYFSSIVEEYDAVKGRAVNVFDLETGSIEFLSNCPDYSKMFWPPPPWVSSIMLEAGLNQLRM